MKAFLLSRAIAKSRTMDDLLWSGGPTFPCSLKAFDFHLARLVIVTGSPLGRGEGAVSVPPPPPAAGRVRPKAPAGRGLLEG